MFMPCLTAAAGLLTLSLMGFIKTPQQAQSDRHYTLSDHTVSVRIARNQHHSYSTYGVFSSPVEVSGFLEYQLHVKWIVPYF
jgi:hypothetical protein